MVKGREVVSLSLVLTLCFTFLETTNFRLLFSQLLLQLSILVDSAKEFQIEAILDSG